MPKPIQWTENYPSCDFCPESGKFDGKTKMGPWANMCEGHLNEHGYPGSNDLTFQRVKSDANPSI